MLSLHIDGKPLSNYENISVEDRLLIYVPPGERKLTYELPFKIKDKILKFHTEFKQGSVYIMTIYPRKYHNGIDVENHIVIPIKNDQLETIAFLDLFTDKDFYKNLGDVENW